MQLSDKVDKVLEALEWTELSITDFLVAILSNKRYENHEVVLHLRSHGSDICHLLVGGSYIYDSASEVTTAAYAREVSKASSEASGSHFNVSRTSLGQLEEFSVEEMGRHMKRHAPNLWQLLGVLLDARNTRQCLENDGDQIMDSEMDGEDDEDGYWRELGETDLDGPVIGSGSRDSSRRRTAKRLALSRALITLVRRLRELL